MACGCSTGRDCGCGCPFPWTRPQASAAEARPLYRPAALVCPIGSKAMRFTRMGGQMVRCIAARNGGTNQVEKGREPDNPPVGGATE